jgi:diguanylate cyclase (GGDEF)-like protein/hemerythrin-like metal-binding protein
MLDLDHFKVINDALGHAAGDRVLRGVADGLRAALRTSDSITRWGGEEFLILMPNTGLASATILAERIREAIAARPFEGIGPVTASLGLSEFVPPESLQAWVERTDQAMYRAKAEGRNRVAVDPRRRETPESAEGALQLVWKEDYRSGHAAIDAQHEHLFHRANQLLDAILSQRPKEDVADLVAQTFAVARQHFQDEEAILAALGYPGLAHHVECHAAMLRRAQELSQAYQSGTLPVGDLFHFLAQEVVAEHLLKEDREFFHLLGRREQPG